MKTKTTKQIVWATLILTWLASGFAQAQDVEPVASKTDTMNIQEPEPAMVPPMTITMPYNSVPAFPGAWGGGMYTTGGQWRKQTGQASCQQSNDPILHIQ